MLDFFVIYHFFWCLIVHLLAVSYSLILCTALSLIQFNFDSVYFLNFICRSFAHYVRGITVEATKPGS